MSFFILIQESQEKTVTNQPDQGVCEECGQEMEARINKHGKPRRFCDVTCRQRAWRRSGCPTDAKKLPEEIRDLPPMERAIAEARIDHPIGPSRRW
jgi:hypothetical protein